MERMNTIQWYVTKYGKLIERSDIRIGGVGIITTKVYLYKDRYYTEVWDTGYCIHFSEMLN